jgi:hypothetical protein
MELAIICDEIDLHRETEKRSLFMKLRFVTSLLTVALLIPSTARSHAQTLLPTAPQKRFARVLQEVVKPGSWTDYEKIQTARAEVLKQANWPRVSIALVPIAGADQVLHYSFYDTFADMTKDTDELNKRPELRAKLTALDLQEAALLVSRRNFIITYHPDISYQGDFSWQSVRYSSIIFIHLHPGHGDEYLANRKIVLTAHHGANLPENLALFTTFAGGPSSSYWIMRPTKTLPEFDEMDAMHGDAYGKVLGDENRKRVHDLFAASVETEEEDYFRTAPSLSYVTSEWAGADAGYWMGGK